jgi:hypothetical protein
MLKKFSYGVAFLLGALISLGIFAVTKAKTASGPVWTDHPNPLRLQQPTVLTKHQLFSEDHTADVVAVQQVWGAYTFYNDSDNGPGMASLFTPDGVDQHVWVDAKTGLLTPHYGVVAPGDEGKRMAPENHQLGSGCVLHGRDQISFYFGKKRRPDPIPWPGHGHHESPSMLVKVSDDGQTAVLSTPYVIASTNDKGEGRVSTGGYRAFYKKTSEGWEIAELYAISDNPVVSPGCDLNGPQGMPK